MRLFRSQSCIFDLFRRNISRLLIQIALVAIMSICFITMPREASADYLFPPITGCGASIDASNGRTLSPYLGVNNTISCSASDGAGGFYIGGFFTQVNGVTRNRIAHILPNGSLDAAWNPNADGEVSTIAVSRDRKTVYAGGDFGFIGTQGRSYIAALNADPSSINYGKATAWNPRASHYVKALAVGVSPNGTPVVYAIGEFRTIGEDPNLVPGTYNRNCIAALNADPSSINYGRATAWNPSGSWPVHGYTGPQAIAVSPDGLTVYIGGAFTLGGTQHGLFAISAQTGVVLPIWSPSPNPNGIIYAIAVSPDGNTVYVGGDFTEIGWQRVYLKDNGYVEHPYYRKNIAAIRAVDGQITGWNPRANDTVKTISVSPDGRTVYAGGEFTKLEGPLTTCPVVTRNKVAAIDSAASEPICNPTGIPTSWDPNPNGDVYALALNPGGSIVYVGGYFTIIGSVIPSANTGNQIGH